MVSKLRQWEQAVKNRKTAIMRTLRKLSKLKPGPMKRRATADLHDMMLYGVMDRHKHHWHKIEGTWFLDSVKSKKLRK